MLASCSARKGCVQQAVVVHTCLLLCIAAHSDILSACTRVHALCAYKLVNKMRVTVLLPVLLLVLGITLAAGVGNNDGADDGRDQHHGAAWWPVGHKRPLASKSARRTQADKSRHGPVIHYVNQCIIGEWRRGIELTPRPKLSWK